MSQGPEFPNGHTCQQTLNHPNLLQALRALRALRALNPNPTLAGAALGCLAKTSRLDSTWPQVAPVTFLL